MKFTAAPIRSRRKLADLDMVPMINVVFLLLIFFLTSATLRPGAPVDLRLPVSPMADPLSVQAEQVIYISRDGEWAFGDLRGKAAVLRGIEAAQTIGLETVSLAVDAQYPAEKLTRALSDLGGLGIAEVDLMTTIGGARE